jgi:26-hydroxylase
MKHWGSGMDQIEQRVQHEAFHLLDTLYREHNSKAVDPAGLVNCAVSNVICSMIMSTRFEHTSKEFQHFMHIFDEGFRLFTLTGAMIYLPFLKHMPGVAKACKQLRSNRSEMLGFVRDIIKSHKTNLDSENPRDLIDSYLIAIEKMKTDNSDNNNNSNTSANMFHGFDPEQQLEQIVLDLFSAGVETLKTSLLWAIVYMLHNPEVMTKVQNELDEKVGPYRLPTVKDMGQLTYTKATLYEIMRRSSVVPMGTTHSTDRYVLYNI